MTSEATFVDPKPLLPSLAIPLWQRSAFIPLLPALFVCGIANLAVAPLMDAFNPHQWGALFVYSCFGWNVAQVGLLSIAMTLGNELFLRRLVICWTLATVLLVLWIAGVAMASNLNRLLELPFDREGRVLTVAVPIIFVAAQVPLWIPRIYFGWRLKQSAPVAALADLLKENDEIVEATVAPAGDSKLSIRDLLITTALISLVLGFGRLVSSDLGMSRGFEFWGMMAVAGVGAMILSLITTVPLLRILSLPHSLSVCCAMAGLYALVVGGIVASIPLTNIGGLRADAWAMVGLSMTIAHLALGMLAGLILLRTAGWTLQRSI